VIRYPDDFTLDDVPTCADLRLLSSGGGSELLEWDMDRGSVRVSLDYFWRYASHSDTK
jgi:U3 small nucleolar RNA-associated protein 4